ncbi:hypothetical protein GGTG_06362 [Gaeumannomyces tritici R3-111a-1]|uniref:PSI domain-containing protein n=1 Tax=Gaeumannomyces tritici (strain R3-111a-1) TaxID=644352 RepID=J3NYL0_GAET3|nr:hypothetical protein GGTG_06362 [Gaeumannomyces tritici R3-111a-1]EJT76443.1 hypothetical protein GGTG_06362 [Gaeumannomyces tritici R3-111a-1]
MQPIRESFNISDWEDDKQFLRCWRHQDCGACLVEDGCSWCPFSWTCTSNTYSIPLLAPAYDDKICPHWAERWEIRTRPLGCQVSTITTLTGAVSIASTLIIVGIIFFAFWLIRKMRELRRWRREWARERALRRELRAARLGRRVVFRAERSEEDPLLGI